MPGPEEVSETGISYCGCCLSTVTVATAACAEPAARGLLPGTPRSAAPDGRVGLAASTQSLPGSGNVCLGWKGLASADKGSFPFSSSFCSFQPSLKGRGAPEEPLTTR